MSNEMIERVKAAIENRRIIEGRIDYDAMAKAAIEAMQEPTQEMLDAGSCAVGQLLEVQYKAMIEAALK